MDFSRSIGEVTGLPDVYLTTLSLRPAVFEVRNFMSSQAISGRWDWEW